MKNRIKEYLKKYWYNTHNSKYNIYFRYWSFESAAIVKINGAYHHCNNEVVGLINFEGRGPRCCLMRMTGDVTKIRLSLFFNEETMFGA
ncbi:MAG: DUF1911 domain-containing protein, partial [Spirochaetales bacterium]|nr:DUF1911 domain-containing protein [Spirochaetales bacterium]